MRFHACPAPISFRCFAAPAAKLPPFGGKFAVFATRAFFVIPGGGENSYIAVILSPYGRPQHGTMRAALKPRPGSGASSFLRKISKPRRKTFYVSARNCNGSGHPRKNYHCTTNRAIPEKISICHVLPES